MGGEPMKTPFPEYPDLWRRFQQDGCQQSRTGLIEKHRPLVFLTLARFARPARVSLQDLESEGFIGLVKAVDRFQPTRRVRFSSFAITQIRFAFTEYLRTEDWAPRSVREKQKRLLAAWQVCQRPDRTLDPAEAARYLGLDQDAYDQLCREARPHETFSLSDECSNEGIEAAKEAGWGRSISVADTLGYTPDFVTPLADAEVKAALWREIEHLPKTHAYALKRLYIDGLTLKAIANQMHRCESRIHQYADEGRTMLRKRLAGNDLFETAARERAVGEVGR
jgi:RNA polymerase sigma factor for flagellar operon FliA